MVSNESLLISFDRHINTAKYEFKNFLSVPLRFLLLQNRLGRAEWAATQGPPQFYDILIKKIYFLVYAYKGPPQCIPPTGHHIPKYNLNPVI